MKRVGFFGGSFDPIHLGHINLAVEMLEKGGLDEVLFCPAYCSPFKLDRPPVATGEQRYEMVSLVVKDIPGCSVTSVEVERKGPSYTVETLRRLQRDGVAYRLIIAETELAGLERWKEAEEVKRLAPPLVGSRGGGQGMIKTSLFDVSSTQVRERLSKGMYCGHLIPSKALDYIVQHKLYFSLF